MRHRRGRWLDDRIEQGHRRIERLTPADARLRKLPDGTADAGRGEEVMVMLSEGLVRAAPASDMPAQRAFVHQFFGPAA